MMSWSENRQSSAPQVFTYSSDLEVVPISTPSQQNRYFSDQERRPILYSPPPEVRPPLFTKVRCGVFLGTLVTTLVLGGVLGGALGSNLSSCHSDLSQQAAKLPSTNATTLPQSSGPTNTTTYSCWVLPTNTTGLPPRPPWITTTVVRAVATSDPPTPTLLEDYKAPLPSSIDLLYNDCTPTNDRINAWGDRYATTCGRDSRTGVAAAEGGLIAEILVLTAYSFNDCLDACSSLNRRAESSGWSLKCRSVAFHMNMKNVTAGSHGNCWLKNGTLLDPNSAIPNQWVHTAQLAI